MVRSKSPPQRKPKGLDRTLRIRRKADFALLRKNASKWVARHWILFYGNNEEGLPRLAVTLSAKYGNAVQRNRFRRQMRELFRCNQAAFSGWDMHFVAKQKPSSLAEKQYKEELHEDFQKLLRRFS